MYEDVGSRVIVSLDAAQVFDSIELNFLLTTLYTVDSSTVLCSLL